MRARIHYAIPESYSPGIDRYQHRTYTRVLRDVCYEDQWRDALGAKWDIWMATVVIDGDDIRVYAFIPDGTDPADAIWENRPEMVEDDVEA